MMIGVNYIKNVCLNCCKIYPGKRRSFSSGGRTVRISISSWLVIQSSIYPAEGNPSSNIPEEVRNYNLQASTALIMLGYKLQVYNLQFDTGFVQDYSNRGNETDFVVFFEAGLRW